MDWCGKLFEQGVWGRGESSEMTFIDLLIQETTERFGLGNKSIAVISALVATMNQPGAGGLEGFLTHFRNAGFTDHVQAWLTADQEKSLTSNQLEAALPALTLQQIADKTQLPLPQTTEVLAFLVPLLVRQLASYQSELSTYPNDIRRALWSHQPVPPAVRAAQEAEKPTVAPARVPKLRQIAAYTKARGARLLRTIPFD